MTSQPSYPAERAADVVLFMAICAAIVFIAAGAYYLGEGSDAGWVLIGLGILPVPAALWVRGRVRRDRETP